MLAVEFKMLNKKSYSKIKKKYYFQSKKKIEFKLQVLAWLSLFIPAESVPGRVGMVMTTMLTLTAMFASVR